MEFKKDRLRTFPDGRMTPESAAAYLGCSVQTLANLRTAGRGPAFVKPNGNRVYYFRTDLDAWIQRTRSTSTAQARLLAQKPAAEPQPAGALKD